MTPLLAKFDAFLSQSDSDSMDWNDGGDYEVAQEMVDKFNPGEWEQLKELVSQRPADWRSCMVYSLEPRKGILHSELLLDFVFDTDDQIALEASHRVAFYCGALHGQNGVVFDPRIRSEHMILAAKSRPGTESAFARFPPELHSILHDMVKIMFSELGITPSSSEVITRRAV